MRLPTVKLKHPTKGTRILNATDYQREFADRAANGWKVVSERHGDASDELVDFLRRQDEKEIARKQQPGTAASGDDQRAYEGRAISGNIETGKPATPSVVYISPAEAMLEAAPIKADLEAMSAANVKALCESRLGKKAATKKEAIKLLTE